MSSLYRFAELSQQLSQTTKKLEKRAAMAAYLGELPVEDAMRAALYLSGQSFAETDLRKLSVGGSTLSKAIAQLSGADAAAMHAAYRRHGDLGAAAFDLLTAQSATAATLTLADLETMLTALAAARGPAPKLKILLETLSRATPLEAKYIVKLISGDMRTGVKQAQVEEAIAVAYTAELPAVRRAGMLLGSLPEVVARAAAGTLGEARMRLFHPLGFMLASPVDSVEEALARFTEEVAEERAAQDIPANEDESRADSDAAEERELRVEAEVIEILAAENTDAPQTTLREAQLEDKYDGMRAQLHCGDPSQPHRVGLFSRNREDLSESFPELIEAFAGFETPVILDGEILAWKPVRPGSPKTSDSDASRAGLSDPGSSDPDASDVAPIPLARALPFSSLQQRLGRKRVTAEMREQTPVIFMAFDLLYQGDELLLEEPLGERRRRLETFVASHAALTTPRADQENGQQALFSDSTAEPASTFPRLVLAPATILSSAAQLDQAYTEARARGNEGVMLKARGSLYQPGRRGLAWLKLKRELATLDVVITGAEFGHGRRAGVLSDYTFAVRSGDELLNVGKAYSGLTDAEIDSLSRRLQEQTIEDFGGFRTVEPVIVLEVAFNNVMRSSRHASGFALRFPRILRIRDDKPLEEIDTLERVEEIYNSQPDRPVQS